MTSPAPPARRSPLRAAAARVALGLYVMLRDGFLTSGTLAALLQVPRDEAEETLDVLAGCTVDEEPLIRSTTADLWLPAAGIVRRATADARSLEQAQRRGLLGWYRPNQRAAEYLVRTYVAAAGRISSGEPAGITGLTTQGALNMLTRMESEGIVQRGAAQGRRAHFIATDR